MSELTIGHTRLQPHRIAKEKIIITEIKEIKKIKDIKKIIKPLNKSKNRLTIKSYKTVKNELTKVNKLNKITKVIKPSKIIKVSKVSKVRRVNKASKVNKANKANKTDEIDTTDKIDEIDTTDKIDKIDKIDNIDNIDKKSKLTLIITKDLENNPPKAPEIKIKIFEETLIKEDIKNIRYLTINDLDNTEALKKLVVDSISKSRKIIVLTGAGISCNAGIPDFRSKTGLYNKDVTKTMKGKEMFDISVYKSINTIQIFNQFIQEFYEIVKLAKPTRTHEFIKKLKNKGKLIKCYTQNIDGLERECGLVTKFSNESWNRLDVVQLHGDLHQLCCSLCMKNFSWEEIYNKNGLPKVIRNDAEKGEEEIDETNSEEDDEEEDDDDEEEEEDILIECPSCINKYQERIKLGKRCCESHIGIIRPNIVLYGENHPYAEIFAKGLNKDLQKKPNLLLIFGTSLKVTGVKSLVRRLSKKIHQDVNGKVVLVNKEPISNSVWKNYIDYQILSDCDKFCEYIESNIPKIFGVKEENKECIKFGNGNGGNNDSINGLKLEMFKV